MTPFNDVLNQLSQNAHNRFHRQLILISGDRQWCRAQISAYFDAFQGAKVWLSDDDESAVPYSQVNQHLGSEYQLVCYDAHSGFNCNAFAAICGTLSGGGLCVLLTPALSSWPGFDDPDLARLAQTEHTAPRSSLFLSWLSQKLGDDKHLYLHQQAQSARVQAFEPQMHYVGPGEKFYRHQQDVVDSIIKVACGHRNRPLVITADRGRGKSASLGLAAAALSQREKSHVLITAPNFAAVSSVFKHAQSPLDGCHPHKQSIQTEDFTLAFMPVDKILRTLPQTDLLMIDEAAAIPTGVLKQLQQHYSRVVFATTQDGYEGNGLGFAIRFMSHLKSACPDFRQIHMHYPARWAPDDPLEQLINQALVFKSASALTLNEHLPDLSAEVSIQDADIVFVAVTQQKLHDTPDLLAQVFSLLINAHYQTSPDDLRSLLDHPAQILILAKQDEHVIGVILLHLEQIHGFALQQAVWQGQRRCRGQLLPQQLAISAQDPSLLDKRFLRVVRIAVAPSFQRQHIGAELLSQAAIQGKALNCDYLGSSFSFESGLFQFWRRNRFTAVHLGLKVNAASGAVSVAVLRALNSDVEAQMRNLRHQFAQHIRINVRPFYDQVRSADLCDLVHKSHISEMPGLRPLQRDVLELYCQGRRQLNQITTILDDYYFALLVNGRHNLTKPQRNLLFDLLLRKLDSQTLVKQHGFSGSKSLNAALINAVSTLINQGFSEV